MAQSADHSHGWEADIMHQAMNSTLRDWMDVHGQDVWNFIFTLTRNHSVTDDITQDVFIKAYQKMSLFRNESSPKTWLLKIARNAVYDHQRSAFIRKVTLLGAHSVNASSPSAEHEALTNLVQEEIWKIVLSLPQKLREILVLYGHNGLSMEETAQILGISVGTVKSRLHRARQRLENQLKDGVFDEKW